MKCERLLKKFNRSAPRIHDARAFAVRLVLWDLMRFAPFKTKRRIEFENANKHENSQVNFTQSQQCVKPIYKSVIFQLQQEPVGTQHQTPLSSWYKKSESQTRSQALTFTPSYSTSP